MEVIAIEHGRMFQLVSIEPYIRKDGSASALAIWRGTCRVCGAAFELKTPASLGSLVTTKSLLRVHCDLHKRVGRMGQPNSDVESHGKSPATDSTEPTAPLSARVSE